MITLLSDWKLRDPYIGIFKGQLLRALPQAQMIDITHHLEQFNPSQTAFVAKNCFSFFPEKTLHIILSGLSFSSEVKPVLVSYKDHFFLGEDTGIFFMMFGMENTFEARQYNGDMSLGAIEKLACMAQWVFQGNYLQNTSPYPALKFQLSNLSEPDYNAEQKVLSGKIVYIDSHCNAVTNIPIAMFETIGKKTFTAMIANSRSLKITRYHPNYNPQEPEVYLAHNRLGFLEITLYKGNISALADIKVGNDVEIHFK
jgi:S-adenosylmethionine hydrolase